MKDSALHSFYSDENSLTFPGAFIRPPGCVFLIAEVSILLCTAAFTELKGGPPYDPFRR